MNGHAVRRMRKHALDYGMVWPKDVPTHKAMATIHTRLGVGKLTITREPKGLRVVHSKTLQLARSVGLRRKLSRKFAPIFARPVGRVRVPPPPRNRRVRGGIMADPVGIQVGAVVNRIIFAPPEQLRWDVPMLAAPVAGNRIIDWDGIQRRLE